MRRPPIQISTCKGCIRASTRVPARTGAEWALILTVGRPLLPTRGKLTSARSNPSAAANIRENFPILGQVTRGKKLVFLDSGASAQEPCQVIAAMTRCMEVAYANVHRGAYRLSEVATEAHGAARAAVASFINAASPREIIFTRISTEALNLVALSHARRAAMPPRLCRRQTPLFWS